jgi:hypothetical protein
LTEKIFICNQAESDSEFDKRYEAYFNRADIDGWEIRKVILLIFTEIMLCIFLIIGFFPQLKICEVP